MQRAEELTIRDGPSLGRIPGKFPQLRGMCLGCSRVSWIERPTLIKKKKRPETRTGTSKKMMLKQPQHMKIISTHAAARDENLHTLEACLALFTN